MKTCSIIRIVYCALLMHIGHTQCFFLDSVKVLLQATGLTCGVFVPMVPTLVGVLPPLAKTYMPLSSHYSQLRSLTDQEADFYSNYIDADIAIVYTPEKNNHASSCGNTIILPERLTYQGIEWTLIDALKESNSVIQHIFAGIAEHEAGHITKNHRLKSSLACITATSVVTALSSLCTSAIMPLALSDSMIRHVGWCGLKVGGSFLSLAINAYMLAHIFRFIGRSQEFEADQNVTAAHRKPLMEWLAWADTNDYMSRIKNKCGELSIEQQQEKVIELQEKDYAALTCIHPSPQERRKALLGT